MRTSPTSSDWPRSLCSIDQLTASDVRALLTTAQAISEDRLRPEGPFSMGLVMMQPSLRTRLGFSEAARRLGGYTHLVESPRNTANASAPESLEDTLQIVADLTDLVVLRAAVSSAALCSAMPVPVINGGDEGEHPTQALLDLFAIERLCGPIGDLTVGICGDFSMRAARSLLKLLVLCPPARLRLIAPPSRRGDAWQLIAPLLPIVEEGEPGDLSGLDVLYMVGLPMRRDADVLTDDVRLPYALCEANARQLPTEARVFSPMPVIDEIGPELRRDSRLALFEQNRLGLFLRMAVLARMLNIGEQHG